MGMRMFRDWVVWIFVWCGLFVRICSFRWILGVCRGVGFSIVVFFIDER